MPTYIKFIGRYGNGLVVLLCILGLLNALSNGSYGGALVLVIVAGLAAFNAYVIHKSARLLEEEEWLKAEVRKVELRRRLAGLGDEPESEAADSAERTPGGRP